MSETTVKEYFNCIKNIDLIGFIMKIVIFFFPNSERHIEVLGSEFPIDKKILFEFVNITPFAGGKVGVGVFILKNKINDRKLFNTNSQLNAFKQNEGDAWFDRNDNTEIALRPRKFILDWCRKKKIIFQKYSKSVQGTVSLYHSCAILEASGRIEPQL